MKNEDHNDIISEWISTESQHVCDEWADDDHHIILQVTVTV